MLQTALLADPDPGIDPRDVIVAREQPEGFVRSGTYGAGGTQGRAFAISLTIALHVVIAAVLLVRWHSEYVKKEAPPLSVFDVAPPAPPAEKVVEQEPTPEIVPPQQQPVEQPKIETPRIQIPLETTTPAPVVRPVPPAPPVERTPPPEARPAPAPPPPGTGKPTWEGQVLASLNKVRRYPREALFRKQQGVPYIRFVMDREGKVLSSRLERSSGVPSLDAEAVGLPKRAQPLPKPPESVAGDTVELVVPVEFFLK